MQTRMTMLFLFTGLAAATLSGCGSDDDGGDSGVSSLALRMEEAPPNAPSACAQENGACDCPRDASQDFTLVARNEAGAEVEIDPSAVTWTVDTVGPTVDLVSDGASATVTALQDWFDNAGAEGTATLRAEYRGRTASMPINVVIDASGNWQARLDNGFTYLLSLRQTGRTIVDSATGYSGRVTNDALTLAVSSINVSARFTSRTQVSGTYSSASGGLSGTLTCTRQ
jgi:hypothetical protein